MNPFDIKQQLKTIRNTQNDISNISYKKLNEKQQQLLLRGNTYTNNKYMSIPYGNESGEEGG